MPNTGRKSETGLDNPQPRSPEGGARLTNNEDSWMSHALKLEAEIERLRAALKPFADAVYNDNGDVTITPCGTVEYFAAQRALENKP